MFRFSDSTNPLAIAAFGVAAFGCFCQPALIIAPVLGVIALVQLKKNPQMEGRWLAIFGIAFPLIYGPLFGGILFFALRESGLEEKRKDCIETLRAISEAEEGHRTRNGAFTEDLRALRVELPRDTRYAFVLSSTPEWNHSGVLGRADGALPEDEVRRELDRPLAGGVSLGVDGDVFTALCVANIDSDDYVDVWSVSSEGRQAENGDRIAAGDPYNDWNDKKNQRGGWSYEK